MPLPRLPDLVTSAYLTSVISPTLVSFNGSCALRLFGREHATHRHFPSLITGPATEIGNLTHQAIELADKRINLIEVFNQLLERRQTALRDDNRRSHYADLSSSVDELKWARTQSILREHSGNGPKLLLNGDDADAPAHQIDPNFSERELIWPSVNYEVPLYSESLGLSGRADRIELNLPDEVIIADLKTGKITSDDGKVKQEYILQMAAYEALAKEKWPNKLYRLFLESGSRYELELTDENRRDLSERIQSLKKLVGSRSKSVVSAISAQGTGQHCLRCPIRHTCESYRQILAKDSFSESIESEYFKEISDGFGVVTSKEFIMGYHVTNIETFSKRKLQIRSKYNWQVSQAKVDEEIYFFGFTQKLNNNRLTSHVGLPSNFSDDFFSGRNWSAEVFVSKT